MEIHNRRLACRSWSNRCWISPAVALSKVFIAFWKYVFMHGVNWQWDDGRTCVWLLLGLDGCCWGRKFCCFSFNVIVSLRVCHCLGLFDDYGIASVSCLIVQKSTLIMPNGSGQIVMLPWRRWQMERNPEHLLNKRRVVEMVRVMCCLVFFVIKGPNLYIFSLMRVLPSPLPLGISFFVFSLLTMCCVIVGGNPTMIDCFFIPTRPVTSSNPSASWERMSQNGYTMRHHVHSRAWAERSIEQAWHDQSQTL